ncbi:monocarboxylate transporter 14 [Bicyclus anynana]|uniref:Monocarboxylate transporter 14 n=1 Tax=Bicyclus anynana TaxID=110368 RepID=A0ABM3LTW3_BICAN|nr:monocarboxylate transporter 14 [Bicyclus anynana]
MVGNETKKPNDVARDENGQDLKDLNKINSLKLEDNYTKDVVHYTKDESPPGERVKFEGLDDIDSICSKDDDKLPPIPDGGWGWVVVFAAFLTASCADGLTYSFGILHEEFINYFQDSQSKTSLIGSLFISIPLISGPIMSALVDRYGCRTMNMAAGILSTIGFLLASLSNSIEMLCVTLGVISGFSMGIFYVTAVVSVAFWFDKRRTLAVSIAHTGVGFGTLVYSPLTNYLLQIYDWRNTLVLLGGTVLNMCVCGALMRDPDWIIIKEHREKMEAKKSRSRRSSSAGSISSKSIGNESVYLDADELNDLLKSGRSPEYILAMLTTSVAEAEKLEATTQMNAEIATKRANSDVHLPTFVQHHDQVPAEVIEKLMTNKRLYNIILHNYPHILTRRRSEENVNVEPPISVKEPTKMNMTLMAKKPKTQNEFKQETEQNKAIKKDLAPKEADIKPSNALAIPKEPSKGVPIQPAQANWISRQISTDHHYLRDMPLYKGSMMYRGAMMNIPRYKLRASSLPDIYRNSTWSIWSGSDNEKKWYDRLIDGLKSTFDFRMFTEFHFFLFNMASLILAVWAIIPYFFLKSYMSAVNMEGGATMIAIVGIASGIGIVVLGWAGDQPWINVTKAFAICLFICGISIAAYPLCINNYWALAVVSVIFGWSYASSYAYTPAILIELVPIDYFTLGYGLILLSQGIGHLCGPPIGGLLFDITKSWDLTFYVGGLWVILAGILVGIIPYTNNMRMCGSAPLLKDLDDGTSTKNSVHMHV